MINLLPPSEKQNLLEEERWKLILILVLIVFVFFISLILIFLSLNIYVSSQLEAQKVILSQKEAEKTEIQDFQKEINQANQTISELNSFYEKAVSITGFLDKISNLLPKDVFLTDISVSPIKKEENKFQVSLSGYAPLIENLIELRENLKKENEFSQIYFPSSIWVETKDINFSITFQAIIKNEQ